MHKQPAGLKCASDITSQAQQRQFKSMSEKCDRMMRGDGLQGQSGFPAVSIQPTATAILPQPGPSQRQQQQGYGQ